MKKSVLLAFVALTLAYTANAQLTKDNWLVGGNVLFKFSIERN